MSDSELEAARKAMPSDDYQGGNFYEDALAGGHGTKFHATVVPGSCCIIEGATPNVVVVITALPGHRLEPMGVGRVMVVPDESDQPAIVPQP